jgi:hypothetical protein
MAGIRTFVITALGVLVLAAGALAQRDGNVTDDAGKSLAEECALLDDAKSVGLMDGLLVRLAYQCDRMDLLGRVRQEVALEGEAGEGLGTDVGVNDPTGDSGVSTTQSETSIAHDPNTGTICSGYNDSFHGVVQGQGFTGFSRSTDGGATFDDRGPLGSSSFGDPSVVWRRVDGKFYFAALDSLGLGIWRSDDDCQTFTLIATPTGGSDDKELMAVDNDPTSPHYGRLYMAWTDFGAGARIYEVHSDDGTTWTSQQPLSGAAVDVQGAWPAVAPNGDVYVGWLRWNPFPSGPIDVEISKSTDGGATWNLVTNPITGEANPRDAVATGNCGRPALNENIRYLPSPQIVVGQDGVVHTVYSYDPDGFNVGDVVDVFYRRSTDGGATWQTEVQLADDPTNDQYFAALSIGDGNIVVANWYDRRLDPNNELQDYFRSVSFDGGVTWEANERVSDVSTPIYLDPNLASCYHGDYDQSTQTATQVLIQWSDDRNMQGGHNDPDVFLDQAPAGVDFLLLPSPSAQAVCAPADAIYAIEVLQFQGFTEPVTLAANGVPAGATAGFSANPVVPPGTSTLTVSDTGAAAPGSYSIQVEGTSSPGSIVHDTTVGLSIFDGLPTAPNLIAPVDGATNQPRRPTFEWGAVAATSYTIEIATDAAFGTIVDSASGLTATTYTASIDLATNTEHFWRVRAENSCGTGNDSAIFRFITAAAPGDCSLGTVPDVLFDDDLEGGAAGWTHSGPGDTWQLSGARTHSGVNAWWGEDVEIVTDQHLVSPPVALPAGAEGLTLQFWNWQTIEDNPPGCFDGAVVEVSDDAGATWIRLAAELLTDPYDGPVSTCCDNPIGGDNAWCGDPQDWLESVVDIDAWAGSLVQFRFRLATDFSVSREGWYVDDVKIKQCVADNLIFDDGFESGDTSAWGTVVP